MSIDENIDDEVVISKPKLVLYSKRSIFLLSLLVSPFMGFVLFALNLKNIGQRKSVVGFLIFFTWSYLFASFPIFGFEKISVLFILIISRLILSFLLIGPLWKRCFQNIDYQETFPIGKFLRLFCLYTTFQLTPLFLRQMKTLGYEPAFFIPSLGAYMIFILLTLLVVMYFFFLAFKSLWYEVLQKRMNK